MGEVVAARHCGMRVLGLSLITNKVVLVPNTGVPANHAEVLEATQMRANQMQNLVKEICKDLRNEEEVLKASAPPAKKEVVLLEDVIQQQAKQIADLQAELQ